MGYWTYYRKLCIAEAISDTKEELIRTPHTSIKL